MRMTHNNVLIQEIKREQKTESGIILTSDPTTGNKPGLAVSVGPECKYVGPNDTVYCVWKNATPITHEGVQYVIVSEEDVLGVV